MDNSYNGSIRVEIRLCGGQEIKKEHICSTGRLVINNQFIQRKIGNAKLEDIVSCTIWLGANDLCLDIENYTATKKLYLNKFYNTTSNLSYLRIKGVDVIVNEQNIDNLQVDGANILLSDCHVKTFKAGIQVHSVYLSAVNDVELNKDEYLKSIDIRSCEIKSLDLLLECSYINIQNSKIELLNLYGTEEFNPLSKNHIKRINIWEHSIIEIIDINYYVEIFKFEDSIISKMIARHRCKLDSLEITNATILDAYNFEKHSFGVCTIDSWELISKSANNKKQYDKRAEAQYHIVKDAYKNESGMKKILANLLDFCTGFGYKPFLTFRALLIIIAVSWGLLVLNNVISLYHYVGLGKRIVEMFLISVAAIGGQSGLCIGDGFAYWVTFVEYIGAVILFAMFVNALYVKYKD